jgi:hypothetical protein
LGKVARWGNRPWLRELIATETALIRNAIVGFDGGSSPVDRF